MRASADRGAGTVKGAAAAPAPAAPRGTAGRRFPSGSLLLLAGAAPLFAISLLPATNAWTTYVPVAAIDLAASFTRMLLAYLLSLGFSLAYGFYAATYRPAERVLIPVLDILQSVPILGFFPIAIVLLVGLTGPHSIVGPNLASIFLIFTSMAWNMVFGVYESVKSIPAEIREAADSFGVRGYQRLREVFLPATINRLVYNSILSWTAGWYFLVAAEFISVASSTTALPGIGSFLLTEAGAQNVPALLTGLGLLVVLIACMDLFLWRPLMRWAERFRYDQAPSGEAGGAVERRFRGQPLRRAADLVVRYARAGANRVTIPFVALRSSLQARTRPAEEGPRFARRAARWVALGTALTFCWLLLITLGIAIFEVYRQPIYAPVHRALLQLPLATAASFGRVVTAYVISLAIALPLALLVTRRKLASRVGLPVIEIVASVPATALFPLFIFALLPYFGFQGAAILMIVTGMLWYLFFNILSGLRSIPPDLEEAARSYGLPRREYYRRLVFPAIFPAYITGSITAFGGGWNTLIIAEYINYSPTQRFGVLGLGEFINYGLNPPPSWDLPSASAGLPLMVAALLVLVCVVVGMNELLWKPLYRRAVDRYRID
jgi:NitT/TauT family transport system permease protein